MLLTAGMNTTMNLYSYTFMVFFIFKTPALAARAVGDASIKCFFFKKCEVAVIADAVINK